MAARPPLVITGGVEGPLDEAVLRRLVEECAAQVGAVHGNKGKDHLLKQLQNYNRAAERDPWFIMVDLDDAPCAPLFRNHCLRQQARYMCFRIVVREIEAWLMADREALAQFLAVSVARVPRNPEQLADPKRHLVQLAKSSRRRNIKEGMVPASGTGRAVGPGYVRELLAFVQNAWRPKVAARNSDSLRRCRQRLLEMLQSFQ